MRPKIGFITSPPMARFLRSLEGDLADRCEILYLVVENAGEVQGLYEENLERVDILLFSGWLFYLTLLDRGIYPKKIFYVFNEFEGDLQGLLLKALAADRSLDLSRIFIDVAFPMNNFLGIRDLLPEDQMPRFSEDIDLFNRRDYGKQLLTHHLNLHEEGLIDLSVTGVGTITKKLEERGLPYLYYYPTKEYVLDFFMQIFTRNPRKQEVVPAVILIRPEKLKTDAIYRCMSLMTEFARKQGAEVSIRHEDAGLLVMMNLTDLKSLTGSFNDISFRKEIEEIVGPVYLGLGSGVNRFQARLNAKIALSTGLCQKGGVFYASMDNELLGPLGTARIYTYQNRPDEKILEMSKRYHVDHQNIQKMMNFSRTIEAETFSAGELADFLGITIRSVSRLMTRIVEQGGAETFVDKTNQGRGRPVKLYRFTW